MQGGNQQQAYDRGITIFSPDGRLYQVEYAREAVKRGSPVVGIRTEGGVVLAARKSTRSPLLEPESIEKLLPVDDHVGVATAGNVADGRQLVDFARRRAQVEQLRYGQPVGVETLTKALTDHIQEYTQTGGARPFGAALLVGGVDPEPHLYECDPGGTPTAWKATAIGSNGSAIREFLEEEYDEGMSLEAGIDLALEALAHPDEEGLTADSVAAGAADAEDSQFRMLTDEEVTNRLAELELLDEDDEDDEE
jgi:proteasome alpha subunit